LELNFLFVSALLRRNLVSYASTDKYNQTNNTYEDFYWLIFLCHEC